MCLNENIYRGLFLDEVRKWLGTRERRTRLLSRYQEFIIRLDRAKNPSLADDEQPYLCFLRDGEGEFFVGRGIVGCHVGAPRTAAANGTVKGSDRTPRRRRPITSRIPASGGFALS